ncbi:MAG: type IV toxin-antitoxin system AbiEi family antitoxin domain-containing protein [Propionibacteriaceae bacterium]|nr:type IV toxin-antitoxin system AbiEi family antitoxin domain-containing protein [Propionibacteriaceae bacterium]
MNEVVTILERLREVAMDQHGLVSSEQASKEGIPRQELVKLAARGRLERLKRGVYLVPQVAGSRYQNWALAVLWTGAPEACLSHETALAAWEISDINPNQIHITVGKHRRLRRTGGERYVIHYADLADRQRTSFEQIPITNVPTTIEQCIAWGTPTYLIKQALERAGLAGQLLKGDSENLTRKLEDRDNG